MKVKFLYLLIPFVLVILLAACTASDLTPPAENPAEDPIENPGSNGGTEFPAVYPKAEKVENRFGVKEAFPGITLNRPLDLQHAGDGSGRIFVVEQRGVIYVLSGPDATQKELFLDIRRLVNDGASEMGLLGLAFHPNFAENGYFFLNYTDAQNTIVARFTVSGNNVDPRTREIILAFAQPFRNHNGGQLAFGPDGYLYIAVGDGGSGGDPQGHGQNRQTFHGNILRIDVNKQASPKNYDIPPDNPFVGNAEGYLEEIYAYGLRNPWRFSFDSLTGRLWAADVGQNKVEEINIVEKGKNYGWNIMEGSFCFDPPNDCDATNLEMPVYEYQHPLGRSITGGHVYRGYKLPLLEGAYIYSDYVTGLIWGLWYHDDYEPANYILTDTDLSITSFGLDENKELYFTAFDGKIYCLTLLP